MTTFRFCPAITGMFVFVGLCCGQNAPLRDPSRRVAPVADRAGSTLMPVARGDIVTGDIALQKVEVLVGDESESPEMHFDSHVEAVEGFEACRCGEKQCKGVCRDPGRPKKPKRDKPGDVDRGDCPPLRYRIPDCKRAGNPHAVAKWAKCSVTDKYSSWFVGGGAAFFRGRCRKPTEGTWGLDYDGMFGHVNNWLKYTRGRKQGGEGAYETDGEPKVVSRAHEILHLGH